MQKRWWDALHISAHCSLCVREFLPPVQWWPRGPLLQWWDRTMLIIYPSVYPFFKCSPQEKDIKPSDLNSRWRERSWRIWKECGRLTSHFGPSCISKISFEVLGGTWSSGTAFIKLIAPLCYRKEIILSTALKGINGVVQIPAHWTVPMAMRFMSGARIFESYSRRSGSRTCTYPPRLRDILKVRRGAIEGAT
jgi:hypothetical protein